MLFITIFIILSMICLYCKKKDIKPVQINYSHPLGYYPDDPLPDKTAYITFDDGPSDWTEGMLDILKKEKIKATFFICGDWNLHSDRVNNDFKKYRTTLIRMIKDGHSVGNHTIDHKNMALLSEEQIASQFDENQTLFNKELGSSAVRMTLVRPPFGSPWELQSPEAVRVKVGRVISSKGVMILWSRHFDSSDSKEWVRGEWYEKGPKIYMGDKSFQEKMHRIYIRLITRANGKGMVIIFHDTHPTSLEILPKVIERLKSEGYKFDTMEDFVKWRWGKGSAELILNKY